MADPRFAVVRDQFVTQIRAASLPGPVPLFSVPLVRVVTFGTYLDTTLMPCAMVGVDDQESTEQNTSSRTVNTMPIAVKCWFQIGSAPGATIDAVHSAIFVALYNAIMSTDELRELSMKAEDTFFKGGGTKLMPMDRNDPPVQYMIALQFEVKFRHRSNDPTQQV